MSSDNRGRSTTGKAAVPYYSRSPEREAAYAIRLMASRFLADRALASDLDEAIGFWRAARAGDACVSCGGTGKRAIARAKDGAK